MACFFTGDRRCCFDDFAIDKFLQQGGWGKVYAATRNSDGKKCALKFFGYTNHKPNLTEINQEISLMISLDKVDGVCQMIGIFDDTPNGLMPEKFSAFRQSYPVIVMELLEGGDMFGKISTRKEVTENYLASTFLSLVQALRSIHARGFIHRDLKLDNVMLISNDDGSPVKLIDFGMMISLEYPDISILGKSIVGTDGYFAPESLTKMQYGYKSDIWQLGCILYTMLAGHPPFHSDKRYRAHIVRGRYYPLKGPSWDKISDCAKDLVTNILDKNPDTRPSLEDILNHPWLEDVKSEGRNAPLGESYRQRIKHMVLRGKLKRCFLETSITNSHQSKKECFQSELPFLEAPPTVMRNESVSLEEYLSLSDEYNNKLLKLKEILVNSIYNGIDDTSENKRRRINLINIEMDEFSRLMDSVDLGMLSSPEVFSIFDENGDGFINAKEFLLALMALRSTGTDMQQESEAARLYFSLFDVDEDGWISKEEMAMVLDCLLHDGAGPMWEDDSITDVNIDEVFSTCDINNDGLIDFEEFCTFYNTLLESSSVRLSTKDSTGSAPTDGDP